VAPVVALHDELVGTRDEGETVGVVKLLSDILTKGVSSSTRRDTPATSVVRIGPEEVAHGTLVRNLLETI
jgi:hypothetical protein